MTEKQKFIKRLYDNERGFLLRMASVLAKNEADAEDLVQEVFIRAMYACDELMTHPNPRAWLTVTLKNHIRNDRRLCANRLNVSLEEFDDLAASENWEPLSDILPKQLSDSDREILIWRFERKMSYREICEKLGISEASCRVKVCRIIKKCRKLMEK